MVKALECWLDTRHLIYDRDKHTLHAYGKTEIRHCESSDASTILMPFLLFLFLPLWSPSAGTMICIDPQSVVDFRVRRARGTADEKECGDWLSRVVRSGSLMSVLMVRLEFAL